MTQKEANRLRMFRATATQLDELKPVWNANPMMHSELGQLWQLIGAIEGAHVKTLVACGKEQREVARDKRDVAITAMMTIVNVTHSWAERMPEEKLLAQRIATRPYLIRRLTEAEQIARLDELHGLCLAARPKITDSPLTDEDYRNAQVCLNNYLSLQDVARKADVERQGENDNLDGLFRQATPLLTRIDRLMENYKTINPVAHAKHRAARSVFDYGTGKRGKGDTVKKGKAPKAAEPEPERPQADTFKAATTDTPDAGVLG